MTTKKYTPSLGDIYNALLVDTYLTAPGGVDARRWKQNQGSDDMRIDSLMREQQLVAAIKSSKADPFTIKRQVGSTQLLKTTELGTQFYELMRLPQFVPTPKHQLSPQVELFRTVAKDMRLDSYEFTGNPLHFVTNDGLREGELVNGLVHRVREGMKRAAFTKPAQARTTRISKNVSASLRYLGQAMEACANLQIERLELLSPTSMGGRDVDARASSAQIGAFLTAVQNDLQDVVVGHWFKREFRTAIGYSHHAILLCDARHPLVGNSLLNALTHRWEDVTDGQGQLQLLRPNPAYYRTSGIGPASHQSTQNLLDSVRLMLETDKYLELTCAPHYPHVSMGKPRSTTAKASPPIQPIDEAVHSSTIWDMVNSKLTTLRQHHA